MKIAILTPTFNYYSGIDRVVEQQAEDYAKKGNKVTVITLEANIKPNSYKVVSLGMPKKQAWLKLSSTVTCSWMRREVSSTSMRSWNWS